ncbi:MAG TPA: SDR family NAD(P)-dependent oxidoreductase, partial [Gammaproteobacteria bacterium]|nr:SDR family NAD(P)-dependent oxidoreductase [Gammaproteobacteria bacterium]
MQIKDKVVVVTGGASGIGKSLCERFAQEGARAVVVADIDLVGAEVTANSIEASVATLVAGTDVGVEAQVNELVARSEDAFGQIDLFCSNAGIFTAGGENVATDE